MTLPKIDIPFYDAKLLSDNTPFKYRPYSVKEEKILLIAKESNEVGQIFSSIEQILNNCIEGIEVSNLTLFDMTYALLLVRSVSVSDIVEFTVVDPDTDERVELVLDLDKVKLKHEEGHTPNIKLDENSTLVMRYPSFKEMQLLTEGTDEELFSVMISCMDALVHGDQVFKLSEVSEEELNEFVESIPKPAFEQIKNFFDTMPVLRTELPYTNSNGDEKTFVIEGMDTFFL